MQRHLQNVQQNTISNIPVQQFEEFYTTYGVAEGDNMYLAPEDRLIIW